MMYYTLARISEGLLPLCYAAAFVVYALSFFRRGEGFERWRRPLLLGALGMHTLSIYARTLLHGHCLVYTPFEMLTLVSFTVTLIYVIVETMSQERGTGMFFIAMALLLQTVSAMLGPSLVEGGTLPAGESEAGALVGIHISAGLFGLTAFAISAVYGVLYLALYRQIRANRFGPFYQRLPSLQLLERMSEKAAIVGVLFLGGSIVLGMTVLPGVLPGFSFADPTMLASLAIWGVYGAALLGKYVARIDGRRVIILSLVGFLGTILSMTVINLVVSGFHRF